MSEVVNAETIKPLSTRAKLKFHFQTYNAGTSTIQPISALYQRRMLDCVVEIAQAVSQDYFRRSNHYRDVPEKIRSILSEFQTLVGSHPDWPDTTQRASISDSILKDLCMALPGQSAKFLIQKESDKNNEVVQETLMQEAHSLHSILEGLERRRVQIGENSTRKIFQNAVEVLKCKEIARIFGMSPIPKGDWPINGVFNLESAYFIEKIANKLLGSESTLSHRKFISLQRVAHYGALTIQGVLSEFQTGKEPERMVALFRNTLCWVQEMHNLLSNINIIRAWKDPDYRRTLEIAELDFLPDHPAGDIVLSSPEFRDTIPEWMVPETDYNCTYQCNTQDSRCQPQTDSCQSWDPQCKPV